MKPKLISIMNSLKIKHTITAFAVFFSITINGLCSEKSLYENIMATVEDPGKPMNQKYLNTLTETDQLDIEALYSNPGSPLHQTHGLALAIAAGDENRVAEFLSRESEYAHFDGQETAKQQFAAKRYKDDLPQQEEFITKYLSTGKRINPNHPSLYVWNYPQDKG